LRFTQKAKVEKEPWFQGRLRDAESVIPAHENRRSSKRQSEIFDPCASNKQACTPVARAPAQKKTPLSQVQQQPTAVSRLIAKAAPKTANSFSAWQAKNVARAIQKASAVEIAAAATNAGQAKAAASAEDAAPAESGAVEVDDSTAKTIDSFPQPIWAEAL
jgi:hypothetical protein